MVTWSERVSRWTARARRALRVGELGPRGVERVDARGETRRRSRRARSRWRARRCASVERAARVEVELADRRSVVAARRASVAARRAQRGSSRDGVGIGEVGGAIDAGDHAAGRRRRAAVAARLNAWPSRRRDSGPPSSTIAAGSCSGPRSRACAATCDRHRASRPTGRRAARRRSRSRSAAKTLSPRAQAGAASTCVGVRWWLPRTRCR